LSDRCAQWPARRVWRAGGASALHATAATRTQTSCATATHADPAAPATSPHVHPSVTSMCDVVTHGVVRTRQALGHLAVHSFWQRAWQRAICIMCLAKVSLWPHRTHVAFGHLVGGHTPRTVPEHQVELQSDLLKKKWTSIRHTPGPRCQEHGLDPGNPPPAVCARPMHAFLLPG